MRLICSETAEHSFRAAIDNMHDFTNTTVPLKVIDNKQALALPIQAQTTAPLTYSSHLDRHWGCLERVINDANCKYS